MDKVVITQFSDPMMGLSWECEPALQQIVARYCDAVELGFAMQLAAQEPLSSEAAGVMCALNPLTTSVVGWAFAGGAPGAAGIIGACMIIAGIVPPHPAHANSCCHIRDNPTESRVWVVASDGESMPRVWGVNALIYGNRWESVPIFEQVATTLENGLPKAFLDILGVKSPPVISLHSS